MVVKMLFDENTPIAPFISVIYREHGKFINDKVKDDGLSFGLYPLLIHIYKNEGIIQEQIAESLHLNESTITRNLKKLENKGFIIKIPDKRTKIIKTTDKGKITVEKVMHYDESWDEKIKNNLTDEEYIAFKQILMKICEDLI